MDWEREEEGDPTRTAGEEGRVLMEDREPMNILEEYRGAVKDTFRSRILGAQTIPLPRGQP